MDELLLPLVGHDGSRGQARFRLEAPFRITVRVAGEELQAEEGDFFESLCRIREQLESLGWRPVCYGAARDVYPSGMCRDMGAGLQAYRLIPGKPAEAEGLVEIFATGPAIEPVTVAEQRAFFDEWRRSF